MRNAKKKNVARVVLTAIVALLFAFLSLFFVSCKKESEEGNVYWASVTDFPTEYYVGDPLVVTGSLKTYYDVDYFDLVPITEDMISGFDTSRAGDVIVTVTSGVFTATVPIHVLPLTATSIEIDADTLPEVIYEKEGFPSGVTFTATMSNGTVREGLAVTSEMLSGFDAARLDVQTVVIGYMGATTAFSVEVRADSRLSISLINAKATYGVGETLATDGARIEVSYESGKKDYATLLPNNVTGFKTDLGGEFVAKVEYYGLKCDYPYSVLKAPASLVPIEGTLPAIYEKGDAFPETGRALLTYDDGTSETLQLVQAEHAPAFSTSSAGSQSVDVIVSGVSFSYSYTVLPAILSATLYGFTPNVLQGSAFDGAGILIVLYEGGGREEIPLQGDARLTLAYATGEVGNIAEKVTFRNHEYSFEVCVYPESERDAVDHIEIAGVFRTIKKGDPLDVSGVQVEIYYKHLDSILVDLLPEWAEVTIPEEFEEDYISAPVVISCFDVTYETTVTVVSPAYAEKVTNLLPFGFRSLYLVGDEVVTAGASLTAYFGGNYRTENGISVEESFVSDFSTEEKGEWEMTVTYGGYSVRVPYRVIDETEAQTVTGLEIPDFSPLLFVGDSVEDIDIERYKLRITYGYGYDDGSGSNPQEIPLTAEMISGGTFVNAGAQSVTLSYGGRVETISVKVYPASDKERVTGISVKGSVTAYVGSDPDFSATKLRVILGYGYDEIEIPLLSQGVEIDPFSNASAGMTRTVVHYQGSECGLFINYKTGAGGANIIDRVELTQGSKAEFVVGEELDGVSLIVYYKDGSRSEPIAVTAEMASGFATAEAGEYRITVSYGGKSTLFRYVVTAAEQEPTQDEE